MQSKDAIMTIPYRNLNSAPPVSLDPNAFQISRYDLDWINIYGTVVYACHNTLGTTLLRIVLFEVYPAGFLFRLKILISFDRICL